MDGEACTDCLTKNAYGKVTVRCSSPGVPPKNETRAKNTQLGKTRDRAQSRRGNSGGNSVAVGTIIADRPPHRSVRALLTHTAPTLVVWRRSGSSGKDEARGDWATSGKLIGSTGSRSTGPAGCAVSAPAT